MRGNGAVLTLESASRRNGPELRLKILFFIVERGTVRGREVVISREELDSEVYILLLPERSCRKQREQMGGVGCSDAKVDQAATEEDDDDDVDEDEEWSEKEETDGSRATYKKNKWRIVAVWTNVTKKEEYRQAADIMTADFNIAGGPTHP